MHVGVVPINTGAATAEDVVAIARKAEEVGLESVWTFEHVMFPTEVRSPHPYGASPDPNEPYLDPLIALGFAASSTSTLRLGTGVSILPQANPLYFAKQVASLDVLSGGRVIVGVGAGWLREEYDALGVPFDARGRRFDDYLAAIKKVWSGNVVEHQSDFLSWSGFHSYPLPVQKPHPPILIGGESAAAIRRVLTHGDGWLTVAGGLEGAKLGMSRLARAAEALGRDASGVEVSALWPFALEGAASVREYEAIGVSRLVAPLRALGEEDALVGMERLGEALARA